MAESSEIDYAVLCREVMGWTAVKRQHRRPPGAIDTWQIMGTERPLVPAEPFDGSAGPGFYVDTPEFEENVVAALMLAMAASRKYEVPFWFSLGPAGGKYIAWWPVPLGHPVEVCIPVGDTLRAHAQALTQAVWALVQSRGNA